MTGPNPLGMSRASRRLRPFLINVAAPIACYFGLRAVGVADLPALLAGGSVAAADAIASLVIRRRLDGLPIFVCCMFVLTGALAWLTHDARVVLLKPSIASAAIGIYLLGLACLPSRLGQVLAPLIAHGSEARAAR